VRLELVQAYSVGNCGCDVYGIGSLIGLGVPGHNETKEASRAEKLGIGAIEEHISPVETIRIAVM